MSDRRFGRFRGEKKNRKNKIGEKEEEKAWITHAIG